MPKNESRTNSCDATNRDWTSPTERFKISEQFDPLPRANCIYE